MTSSQPPLSAHVVLGNRRAHDRTLLFIAGSAAAERLNGGTRLPAFEDVDATRIEQVGADREVEAARGVAGLLHDGPTSHQIAVSLRWLDDKVSRDDHHGTLLRHPSRPCPV